MAELDRSDVVLRFCVEHDIPLKPKAVYGGIIYHQDVTFTYKQVRDSITDLKERGLLRRVKVDDEAGQVRDVPSEAGNVRCYYLPTDTGRERVAEIF
jgi:hypothetical protein